MLSFLKLLFYEASSPQRSHDQEEAFDLEFRVQSLFWLGRSLSRRILAQAEQVNASRFGGSCECVI